MKPVFRWNSLVILWMLPSISALAQLTNQHIYDTVPNVPHHYLKMVDKFRSEPIVTGRIIFLGNSITEGGDWASLTGNPSVINRGISGDNTYGILQRLDDVTKRKPSKVFILIGINDISIDIPPPVIADNYRRIIDRILNESPATQIFVQTLLPLDPGFKGFPQHFDKPEKVTALNVLLKKLALDKEVNCIDLFSVFLDRRGRLDNRYTYDGLHLNAAGYQHWAAHLKKQNLL